MIPDSIRKGVYEAFGIPSGTISTDPFLVRLNAALDYVESRIEELTNNDTHCTNCDSACVPFDDEPSGFFTWKDGRDES